MSPTWLEIAVAVLLLWVAWQIGVMLAPRVVRRFRARFSTPPTPPAPPEASPDRQKPPALKNRE